MPSYFSRVFQRVSASPTNPHPAPAPKQFDVADLYRGAASTGGGGAASDETQALDEKLRQAYFWIVNHAIISPFYDIEYNEPKTAGAVFTFGDSHSRVTLPSGQS